MKEIKKKQEKKNLFIYFYIFFAQFQNSKLFMGLDAPFLDCPLLKINTKVLFLSLDISHPLINHLIYSFMIVTGHWQ